MKVFEINSVCGTGSTGRIACDIKEILKAEGHECKIAYGRGYYKDPDCFKIESDLAFKAHVLLSRITDRQGFYSTSATRRLVKEIENYQPDIIHLHNIHGYYLDIRVLFDFFKKYNKPVVWTLHDCWSFTGHCAHFIYAGCTKWEDGCYDCIQKKDYPASVLLDRSALNYSDKKSLFTGLDNMTVVTPSKWLADLVGRSFLSKFPTKVINNGIDLSQFKPTYGDFVEKHNLFNKRIILGVAGAWTDRKGFSDFIKLSDILPENYKIIMVGLTEKQKAVLPKKILGICKTESIKELAELYTAAEFFVNPTYEDTYPTTNLESLACGTPVITYKTGGSPESVPENCGAVIEVGSIEGIKTAIENSNFSGEDCINFAKNYEKKNCFTKYLDLYKNLV